MYKKIVISICVLLGLLLVWQVWEDHINSTRIADNRTALSAFLPTPLTIIDTLNSDSHLIISELIFTISNALAGFLIGTLVAILVATLFLFAPFSRSIFFPWFLALNAFPIIGFAPMVILLFGQGTHLSIIFISALISYFPVLVAMDNGFKETDSNILDFMHAIGASKWQSYRKVYIPLSLPYLVMSFKLAIPASIIGATIGEWLGSRHGIGQLITVALYQLKPGLLYASLLTLTVFSTLIVLILVVAEQKIFPWKRKSPRVMYSRASKHE